MGITSDGWVDWAIRRPGPAWKTNGGRNGLLGFAAHSAEGFEAGMYGELDKEGRRASWHFSNMKDGRFVQHYSLFEQTWTSGAGFPNNNLAGMESEGVAGQPLTEAQLANVVRFLQDLAAFTHRQTPRRNPESWGDGDLLLVEHCEAARWGADATACPSNRYPWQEIITQLTAGGSKPVEEDDVYHPQHHAAGFWTNLWVDCGFSAQATHQVEAGNTLSGLARAWATTVEEIKQLNGLTSDALLVGQSLKIPGKHSDVQRQGANAWADFGWPPGTKYGLIEVRLESGSARVFHGNGTLAKRVGANETAQFFLQPGPEGWIFIEGAQARFVEAVGLAFWT
jgi:LysM repeat protein